MSLVRGQAVDIVRIAAVADFALRLVFSDGHTVVVDFEPFLRRSLNPQTRQFVDRTRFKSYELRDGNLVWGDYDMCFSIQQLYSGSLGAGWEPIETRARAVAEDRASYMVKPRGERSRSQHA